MPTDVELKQQTNQILSQFKDPYLNQDLITAGAVKSVQVDQGVIKVEPELHYPAGTLIQGFSQLLQTQLEAIEGIKQAQVSFSWSVTSHLAQNHDDIFGTVKNIIAVASCKGGVGKSTVTTNLALALAQEGAKVGLLDADIYGPSQGLMLGVASETRPETIENKLFVPIKAHGLQTMSMAYLVTDKTPMVWRGPMVSGALQQLMMQTHWGELDYLFIDMPPGTGDIQLTLSQKFPVSGALIVTTPQDIALLDAKKGIEMFRKVKIPVLGIVENMAIHICRQCGHHEAIFGGAGADRLAAEYQTEVLGALPLSKWIREQADKGVPAVAQDPESEIAQLYKNTARTLAARLGQRSSNTSIPAVDIS
jgi:ATP-binding protein involved in chromosome partitioning